MTQINQELINKNIQIALSQNLQCKYFILTRKYGTISGNRSSLNTTIYHAIIQGNKEYNKTFVAKCETDLILNYKETKSNYETHQKKIQKLLTKNNIIDYEVSKDSESLKNV